MNRGLTGPHIHVLKRHTESYPESLIKSYEEGNVRDQSPRIFSCSFTGTRSWHKRPWLSCMGENGSDPFPVGLCMLTQAAPHRSMP